ncbi:hypothetical protein Ancab_013574 [Ancistrocladus abbreviatus]
MATKEKPLMMVGMDNCEFSSHALEWTLDNFFAPFGSNPPFKLIIVHAKPSPSYTVGIGGEVAVLIENDLKKAATSVLEKAMEICKSRNVEDIQQEVIEGDPRFVLCDAVEKHHASVLVVGSHGYNTIKRAVLGSVSDYCSHHAHCSVMIIKKPKAKHDKKH